MILNLYSSLPLPMQKKIKSNSVLYSKLTTMVFTTQTEYEYVHLYENQKGVYNYVRTIRINNTRQDRTTLHA